MGVGGERRPLFSLQFAVFSLQFAVCSFGSRVFSIKLIKNEIRITGPFCFGSLYGDCSEVTEEGAKNYCGCRKKHAGMHDVVRKDGQHQ
jgi:hypothetical protein